MLIREADLAPAAGLNAITGETGAGKTILAQAFGLLLGAKGDAAAVGPGAREAYVEAEFDLPGGLLRRRGAGVARRAGARGRARPRPRAPRLRGRTNACLCLGPRRRARGSRRRDRAAARDVRPVRAAPARQALVPARRPRLVLRRGAAAPTTGATTAWRGLAAARRRHDEVTRDAAAEEARLAELALSSRPLRASSRGRRPSCGPSASGCAT